MDEPMEHHILDLPAIRTGYTKQHKAIWRKLGRLYYYFGNFYWPFDLPNAVEITVIKAIKKFMAGTSKSRRLGGNVMPHKLVNVLRKA